MCRRIFHTTLGWIEPSAYARRPPPRDPNRLPPANKVSIQESFSKDRPVLLGRNPTVVIPDDVEGN